MSQTLSFLSQDSLAFPSVQNALSEPNGLLAVGGDLSSHRLIEAYRNGIFPWYSEEDPIMWWSPNPRAVIPTENLYINKTLKKFIKQTSYTVSLNKDFKQVISLCADAPFRVEETWILDEMQQAYLNLHDLGYAHSIEVWEEEKLIGGLYGVAINGFFSGESMFYKKSNASKIALVSLCQLLKEQNVMMIDCQISNHFLDSMGCIEITRESFLKRKDTLVKTTLPKDFWKSRHLML